MLQKSIASTVCKLLHQICDSEKMENSTIPSITTVTPATHVTYTARTTVTLMGIYLTIGCLGVTGNFLVACVIIKNRGLRNKVPNKFILNQSLIDLAAALLLIFHQLFDDISAISNPSGAVLFCRIWLSKTLLWGIFMSSTINLLCMTVDRFIAIVYPFNYSKHFRKVKVRVCLVLAWVLGQLWGLYNLLSTDIVDGVCRPWGVWYSKRVQKIVGIMIVIIQYFLPLLLLLILYLKMITVLHKKAQQTMVSIKGLSLTHKRIYSDLKREERMLKAKNNVIKTLLLVSICFVLCWGPNQIYYLLSNLGLDLSFSTWTYHWTVMMVFCNCCINPFIYCLKYRAFQKCLWLMITCKNNSSAANIGSDSDLYTKVSTVSRIRLKAMSSLSKLSGSDPSVSSKNSNFRLNAD